MTRYAIVYPKGQGDDVLAEEEHLELTIVDGWAVLNDQHGACLAVPSHAGATITRIDDTDSGDGSEQG
jgi:hypothetical protein